MHTYEVTFTDGSSETFWAERIQFGPTHVVFDNTADSLGIGPQGEYKHSLEAALLASTVLMVEETYGASWRKRLQKDAWGEGAEFAWQKTGDGHNGEYVSGHGTHDGEVSFADANGDHNPYEGGK